MFLEYWTRIGIVRKMTAAYCARVYFTQKSSYARVQLRMGFATDKNIFLTKDSFCEKKCKKTGKNMLIRRKMSTWLSFSKSGGSLFPFETLFFFLKQIPVTGSCKNYQNEKKPVQTCLQVFFSGQNSDRFQDRPVKTGNRTCYRFLDRTECRGQAETNKTKK